MNKVNEIVICRDKFKSQEEFENNIRDTIMCLLKNNYIMTVNWDEPGLQIAVIRFNYGEQEYGDTYPYWLTAEQVESMEWEN